MNKISEHISYNEAVKSYTADRHGIDNTPCSCDLNSMEKVAKEVFEPMRVYFDVPIGIASFYRSKKLNKLIGGSKNSRHCLGEAIDIDADIYEGITNKEIFDYIYSNLEYDQLISEFPDSNDDPEWVHVSYDYEGNNRQETLVSYKDKRNKTKYRYYEKA